ncbi:hypothetical protein DEO72_LG2g3186 [Vigna unguiculata]|uniref:Uncharacterized protein n=1 Tax=Vigna unguiculata TaxID=3917 RepID=A0A4D6L305_VIGUN|nr:hypothetical protein DEO72_LG2g3186 [Vigna unguiculata]
MTRSGEKSSPKRDEVGRSLFHTRSGEFNGGTLIGMNERGSSSHAQLENAMSEGVHSRKGGYAVRVRARSSDDGRGSP